MSAPAIDGFHIDPAATVGASASVHLGRAADGRPVVVKIVREPVDDAGGRIAHEAAVLRHLEAHGTPGVPRVVAAVRVAVPDAPHERDLPALVLEPAGVTTLGRLVAPGGHGEAFAAHDNPPRAVFVELVAVLEGIHAAGVVHGDLSPANVVLLDDGSPMIVDFGAAVVDGVAPPAPLAGTPPFAAPEVVAGNQPTVRSDLYSVAMIMVRSLLGAGCAGCDEVVEPMTALTAAGCPPALRDVLASAISPSPNERPCSAAALLDALITAGPVLGARATPACSCHELPVTIELGPRPPARAAEDRPSVRARRPFIPAAAAIVGCALIGVGLMQLACTAPADVAPLTGAPNASVATTSAALAVPPCPPSGALDARTTDGSVPAAAKPPATVMTADIDGSGCPATIAWRSASAEATVSDIHGVRHFRLGVPGDVLVIGDWDGDRRASPALFRPETGMLFEFDAWATADASPATVRGRATGMPGGSVSVRRLADRDEVVVEPATPTGRDLGVSGSPVGTR